MVPTRKGRYHGKCYLLERKANTQKIPRSRYNFRLTGIAIYGVMPPTCSREPIHPARLKINNQRIHSLAEPCPVSRDLCAFAALLIKESHRRIPVLERSGRNNLGGRNR